MTERPDGALQSYHPEEAFALIDQAVMEAQARGEEPLELWLADPLRTVLGLDEPFVDTEDTEYGGAALETPAGVLAVLDPPESEDDPGDGMPPCAHDRALAGAAVVVVTREDYHRDGLKAPDEYTEEELVRLHDQPPAAAADGGLCAQPEGPTIEVDAAQARLDAGAPRTADDLAREHRRKMGLER